MKVTLIVEQVDGEWPSGLKVSGPDWETESEEFRQSYSEQVGAVLAALRMIN